MSDTARDIMTPNAECVKENETVAAAAAKMRDLGVGALPICGTDDKLKGMITDRDIAIAVVAEGTSADDTEVSELAAGTPVLVEADASADDVIAAMVDNQVRRIPVIEDKQLVGMISVADIARSLPDRAGDLIVALSE